jgi:hypothetical protein
MILVRDNSVKPANLRVEVQSHARNGCNNRHSFLKCRLEKTSGTENVPVLCLDEYLSESDSPR